jgi:hypothetical protein
MLTFQITDLDGEVLATIREHQGGEVVIPLNDSRTASVTVSVFDDVCQHIAPLSRMLKVFYHDWLVFWGVILKPSWSASDAANSRVTINAHDPSLAWKKNYHRYGDYVVDVGYPIDGRGLWYLAESAVPSITQQNAGVRHPGILWGVDTSVHTGPKPTKIEEPQPGDGLWAICQRGQNVWESIGQLSEAAIAPDWDLRPIDVDHPGAEVLWLPGFYAEMNVYEKRMVDRSNTVVFHKGFGKNNVQDMTWEPDGDAVRNYAVEVYPGGERDRSDANRKALAHDQASWEEIGIYETWNSSNSTDSNEVLQLKADAWVAAYKEPPDFFTITPNPEGAAFGTAEAPYRYIFDFTVGDLIGAAVKVGYMVHEGVGRVRQVTLNHDGASTMSTTLECVPDVSLPA